MLKMGFDRRWVKTIMACVTSVQYSVRFNSVETEVFKQQGDLDRGTPCLPTCSCLLQKDYQAC